MHTTVDKLNSLTQINVPCFAGSWEYFACSKFQIWIIFPQLSAMLCRQSHLNKYYLKIMLANEKNWYFSQQYIWIKLRAYSAWNFLKGYLNKHRNDLVARNLQVFERLPVRDIIICILNFSLLPFSCIFPFKTKNNNRSQKSETTIQLSRSCDCFSLYTTFKLPTLYKTMILPLSCSR